MLYLIAYDISVDARRTKLAELLEGFGQRVQRSVFECDLNPGEFARLGRELRDLIDQNVDSVRCYRLDQEAVRRIAIYGIGQVTTEPGHYWV